MQPVASQLQCLFPVDSLVAQGVAVEEAEAAEAAAAAAGGKAAPRRQRFTCPACGCESRAMLAAELTCVLCECGVVNTVKRDSRKAAALEAEAEAEAAAAAAAMAGEAREVQWRSLVGVVRSSLTRELLLAAVSVPPLLLGCAAALHRGYSTLRTTADSEGNGEVVHEDCVSEDTEVAGGPALAGDITDGDDDERTVCGAAAASVAAVSGDSLHPAVEVVRRMASKTKPLLLRVRCAGECEPQGAAVAQSAQAGWPTTPRPRPRELPERFFYKEGDDLLQDVGTTLLLHEMNAAWAVAGTRYFTPVYGVYPLSEISGEIVPSAGFIECLPSATPVFQVDAFEYSEALHNSCVGSMVASFVLGLADRHKDNMLLLHGRVFAHIDFGFVAGARPWPFDTGPFPIPQMFKDACDEAGRWETFLDDIAYAYEVVQRRREELGLVAQTLASPLLEPAETPTGHICFATFLGEALGRPPDEVRALAAAGPSNWATRVKDATYYAGQVMRDAGML